jgi:hypothetical protein
MHIYKAQWLTYLDLMRRPRGKENLAGRKLMGGSQNCPEQYLS